MKEDAIDELDGDHDKKATKKAKAPSAKVVKAGKAPLEGKVTKIVPEKKAAEKSGAAQPAKRY